MKSRRCRPGQSIKGNQLLKLALINAALISLHSIYDSIQNHTNSAEQSHHKTNAAGKRLTLVAAIQK
jgi:hypothetical protein